MLTVRVLGRIPIYSAYGSSGVTAEEYCWSLLEVNNTVWAGYSAGSIRIFSATPRKKTAPTQEEYQLLTFLDLHAGGVYSLKIWVGLSCIFVFSF